MENHSDKETCCLFIRVTMRTVIGETVCIIGENHELGNWDHQKPVKLYTNSLNYPVWLTEHPLFIKRG